MPTNPETSEVFQHYFKRDSSSYINRQANLYMTTHFDTDFYNHITEVNLPEDTVLTPTEEKVRTWLKSVLEKKEPGLPIIIGRDLIHRPLELGENAVQAFIDHLNHQRGLPQGRSSFSDLANRLAGNQDVLILIIGKEQLERSPLKKSPLMSRMLESLTGNYIPDYQTLKTKLSKLGTVIDE